VIFIEAYKREVLQEGIKNLGAFTFDPSGNSISWKPPEG
jgi:hypothetical protein